METVMRSADSAPIFSSFGLMLGVHSGREYRGLIVMAETLASFQRAPECCLQWPLLSLWQNPLFCFLISDGDQENDRTSDFRLGASTLILLATVLLVTITLLLSSFLLPLSTNRLLVLLSTLLHIILAVQLMFFTASSAVALDGLDGLYFEAFFTGHGFSACVAEETELMAAAFVVLEKRAFAHYWTGEIVLVVRRVRGKDVGGLLCLKCKCGFYERVGGV